MKRFFLVLFLLAQVCSIAQYSEGGLPISYLDSVNPRIPTISLPFLNNELQQELADSIAENECSSCKGKYYGKGIDLSVNIRNQGVLSTDIYGNKILRLQISSPNAYGLQFYFNQFKLPEGAKLFIYNEERTFLLGAYTSKNNPVDENKPIQFGTQIIPGNNVIFEYFEPAEVDFLGILSLTKTVHVFDKHGPFSAPNGSGLCNINVACPESAGYEKEVSSVAIILAYNNSNNLAGHCSGALINNLAQDGKPYFLTANHCIDGNSSSFDYTTWIFLFNHEATSCSSDGSNIGTSLEYSVLGSTRLSSDGHGSPTSDYLLLELNTSKEQLITIGACYSGWSKIHNSMNQLPYYGIHHPRGDVKKISIGGNVSGNDYLQYSATTINTTHWKINWSQGTTEGGSSGSPLYYNKQIIGQLHGGYANCDINNPYKSNGAADWYGKFSTSWTEGGFSTWLDPNGSGQNSVNTFCPTSGFDPNNNPIVLTSPKSFCVVPVQQGKMAINGYGNEIDVPCISGSIVLKPLGSGCFDTPAWAFHVDAPSYYRRQNLPEGFDKNYCFHNSALSFYWNCPQVKFFLEITEVDKNLNPIESPHFKWFKFQYNNYDADLAQYMGIYYFWKEAIITQDILNKLSVTLLPSHYYRIKFANGDGAWKEAVRYFRFDASDNIDVNYNLSNDLIAKNTITFEGNVSITNDITIKAGVEIDIKPNTTINAGTYQIEPYDCQNKSASPPPPLYTPSAISSYKTETYTSTSIRDIGSENTGNINLNIFPSPNSGTFDVIFPKENSNYQITIFDIYGKVIYTEKNITSQNMKIDISNQQSGVYFVNVISDTKTYTKAFLYQ